jgi:4-amino-4-deoxy-L-arabinose transferase-like glycosyltransferase
MAESVGKVADARAGASMARRRVARDAAAFAVLCGVVIALYLRLPRQGDIWWADASRHALNGAFVLDFLHAMPWRHPMDFALDYYRQWPALTIGFYPPLFSVALAATYALFGISEAAALVAELAFLLLLGWGAYRLSRHWLDAAPSLAVALLLMGAPELYFWGQQVMLDVPAYALLIWAAEFHLRYVKDESAYVLYAAVVLAVLAIYTKYNAAFFAAVMALSLLYARGWRFALDRTALRAAGLGILLLLPLLVVFYKFSAFNLEQAASVQGAVAGRWTIAGLTYYARIMPSVISWPTFVLAAVYCAALPFAPRLRLPRADTVFLFAWVMLGYVFYAMIAIKEPRHILFITFPMVLASVLVLDRTLARFSWRALAPLALACGVFAFTIATRPVPYVAGMRQAAENVAAIAPPETNIAFWGKLDGSFIYAMRAYTGRNDLGVVRLDKLLFSNVAVSFAWGFTQENFSAAQIVEKLQNLHVQYVVMQTHYRDDIDVIRRLEEALRSDKFQEVERIPMTANYPFSDITEFVVYKAVAEVPRGRVAPPLELKIIHKSF